jgi:hypothetical protein
MKNDEPKTKNEKPEEPSSLPFLVFGFWFIIFHYVAVMPVCRFEQTPS